MHKQYRLKIIMKLITTFGVVFCIIMIISVLCTRYYTMRGIELSQLHMKYTEIANEFNKGSDLLTEDVRMFAETGDITYMYSYRDAAKTSEHRNKAMQEVKEISASDSAKSKIGDSMQYSMELMETEYYAMKLTALGYGIPKDKWADYIRRIELTPEDKALSAEEKKAAARQLLFGGRYMRLKGYIASGTNQFLNTMIEDSENEFVKITKLIKLFTGLLWFSILSVAALLLFMDLFHFKYVVNPIVRAAKKMRDGAKIRLPHFLKEMDRLEKSYNELYSENARLVKQLRFMAETDALTRLGNRTAYHDFGEQLQSEGGEALLFVFDVNNLRMINNTQGHAAGDEALCAAADCILSTFGDEAKQNCFRLGGDEFVALVGGEPEENAAKYIEKFMEVQKKQGVGISVGYDYTENISEADLDDMFKQADKMMYLEKERQKTNEK